MARYKTFAAGGGVPAPTLFTDNFNRAQMGTDWIDHMGVSTAAATSFISWVISANNASLENNTATNDTRPGAFIYPKDTIQSCWGQAQFAQVTFVSSNGTGILFARAGPGVMLTPWLRGSLPAANGYYLMIEPEASQFFIARADGALGAAVLLTAAFTLANNDILKITVVPSASQNVVQAFRNGVLQGTVTDTNAARPVLTGAPGMCGWLMDNGRNSIWDDFSCGIGAGS